MQSIQHILNVIIFVKIFMAQLTTFLVVVIDSLCCTSSLKNDCCYLLVPRNYDPSLHPFEVCREYTRALNATKLERVFAKPFLASLDGHRDGVNCMAKHTKSLSTLLSGSCDGEVTVC